MDIHIIEAREKKGISQKELAKMLGVPPTTLLGWETGLHDPKSFMLVKIAKALDTSVDFLLGASKNEVANLDFGACTIDLSMFDGGDVSDDEQELLSMFRSMNAQGKAKLLESAEVYSSYPKYKKTTSDSPAVGEMERM